MLLAKLESKQLSILVFQFISFKYFRERQREHLLFHLKTFSSKSDSEGDFKSVTELLILLAIVWLVSKTPHNNICYHGFFSSDVKLESMGFFVFFPKLRFPPPQKLNYAKFCKWNSPFQSCFYPILIQLDQGVILSMFFKQENKDESLGILNGTTKIPFQFTTKLTPLLERFSAH